MNGKTNKMAVRLRRSACIGFSVFVVVTTIILIAKIHDDIRLTSDYLLTPKFNLATKSNNVERELGFK